MTSRAASKTPWTLTVSRRKRTDAACPQGSDRDRREWRRIGNARKSRMLSSGTRFHKLPTIHGGVAVLRRRTGVRAPAAPIRPS